jgi:hypothetical protein
MPTLFNKPVRFCKKFPPATVRNKLFAMGYHNAAKERGVSIDRLLGTLPRPVLNELASLLEDPVLNELASLLKEDREDAMRILYNSNLLGTPRTPWGG